MHISFPESLQLYAEYTLKVRQLFDLSLDKISTIKRQFKMEEKLSTNILMLPLACG